MPTHDAATSRSTHPAVQHFATQVDALLADADPEDVPCRVAEELAALLATDALLDDEHRVPDPERYRKHILHVDPAGRFTLMAIVWLPGQETDIHGHTAWGAVGVYEGEPTVVCYDCREQDERHRVTVEKKVQCCPGDTATVRPGLDDVHSIHNESDATVITLHAYGLALVEEPDAINLTLSL